MTLSNLLLVFCPTLGMNPALLRALIEHRQAIWDGWMPELSVVGEEDAEEGQVEVQQDQVDADVDATTAPAGADADAEVEATKIATSDAAATLVGPGAVIDEPAQPRDDEFTIEASKDHEAVTCDYEGVRVVPSAALPRLRGSRGSPARVAIVIPLRHLL